MSSNTQRLVYGVGREVFGEQSMNDHRERLMRFFEEATELVRAGGLSQTDCLNIMDYEFNRPLGSVKQGIAGAGCTLYAVASVYGESLESLVGYEAQRVQQKKDEMRAKQAEKPAEVVSARLAA